MTRFQMVCEELTSNDIACWAIEVAFCVVLSKSDLNLNGKSRKVNRH